MIHKLATLAMFPMYLSMRLLGTVTLNVLELREELAHDLLELRDELTH